MTYEYGCTSCGHLWEADQSIKEPPLTDCPECHRASARRQISGGAGFILKGGGWYADGYGSAKPGSSGTSSSSESKSSEGKGSEGKTSASDSGGAAPAACGQGACAGCPAAAT